MKTIKRLGKILVFGAFFFLFLFWISDIFMVKGEDNNRDNIFNYFDFHQLYDLERDSIDVIYLGGSGFYAGISPLDIWNETGIKGHVFSTPGVSLEMLYYYCREIYKQQSPQVIVLDAGAVLSSQMTSENNIRALSGMELSLNKLIAISEVYDSYDIKNYFPIYRLHEKWSSLRKSDFIDYKKEVSFLKGYGYSEHIVNAPSLTYLYNRDKRIELNKQAIQYLEKMKMLCEKKGTQLLLLKIPNHSFTASANEMIEEIANEYNIPYVNLYDHLEEMGFDENICFYDYNPYTYNSHCNYNGARIISHYLATYLQSNMTIISDNQQIDEWKRDFEKFQNLKKRELLHNALSIEEWLDRLNELGLEGYGVFFAVRDDATVNLSIEARNKMQELNLVSLPYDFQYSYLAIIVNGKVKYEKSSEKAISTKLAVNDLTIEMSSAGYFKGDKSSVKIRGKEQSVNSRGINVVVWDLLQNEVVDSVAFDTYGNGNAKRKILDINE